MESKNKKQEIPSVERGLKEGQIRKTFIFKKEQLKELELISIIEGKKSIRLLLEEALELLIGKKYRGHQKVKLQELKRIIEE